MLKDKQKPNKIAAFVVVSESELAKVIPDYSYELEYKNNQEFEDILYSLGVDTKRGYERQDAVQHRNRFNEVVICSRWVGHERIDDEWIKSKYCSQEAIDKRSGSFLLEALYRQRGLTEDVNEPLITKSYKAELAALMGNKLD